MSATISPPAGPSAHRSFGRVLQTGLVVAIAAALVNVMVFVLAGDLLGIPFVFPYPGQGGPAAPLPITLVIMASVLPAIGAALLLAVLARMTRRSLRSFLIVGLVFLIVSLGAPLSLPVALATKLALSTMHLVAAAIIIGGLTVRSDGWASVSRHVR